MADENIFAVETTPVFDDWLERLRDRLAIARVNVRIGRVRAGNFGDAKSVGGGVQELRIPQGPGYRVYFTRRGDRIVLLLVGGDKSTQSRDITKAKALAAEWEDET